MYCCWLFHFSLVHSSPAGWEPGHQLKLERSLLCYIHPNHAHVCRSPGCEKSPFLPLPRLRYKVMQKRKGKAWLSRMLCADSSSLSLTKTNRLGFVFTHDAPNTSCPIVTQSWRLQTHFQLIEFKDKVGYLAWLALWNALQKGHFPDERNPSFNRIEKILLLDNEEFPSKGKFNKHEYWTIM